MYPAGGAAAVCGGDCVDADLLGSCALHGEDRDRGQCLLPDNHRPTLHLCVSRFPQPQPTQTDSQIPSAETQVCPDQARIQPLLRLQVCQDQARI